MVVVSTRRKSATNSSATDALASNSLSLLHHLNGCSSVVYPASDGDRSSSSSSSNNNNNTSSSSSEFSEPMFNKPHKSNQASWQLMQSARIASGGNLNASNFKLLQLIGSGDIGKVYVAEVNGISGYLFAVKIMDKEALASRNKAFRIKIEREILQLVDHPFLPTLYGSFESPTHACLVMDFCTGGDLHKMRQRQSGNRFDEDAVKFYAAEVILAMEYLHMMGVVYRDLKPENVLVRDDGHIMLTDFDLSLLCDVHSSLSKRSHIFNPSCILPNSTELLIRTCTACTPFSASKSFTRHLSFINSATKKFSHSNSSSSLSRSNSSLPELNVEPSKVRSMSFVGTHEYLAPEIINGRGHGSAVDWWTLGIFIYELLYGQTPFRGIDNDITLTNVFSKSPKFPDVEGVSQSAKDLIKALLVKDPRKRLGYSRGAAEIKSHPFFEDINWALIRCTPPPEIPKPFIITNQEQSNTSTFEIF